VLTIAETPETLTVYTPTWISAIALILCLAFLGFVVFCAVRREKLNVRIVAAGIASLACLLLAWTFFGNSVTLQQRGVISDGPLGEKIRAPWSLIRSWETDERPSARYFGKARFLVLAVDGGDEVVIPLTGLDDADAIKVINFVKARVRK
jgi:hypothetical protein